MDSHLPVTDDELHAFVDNELPLDRRAVVAEWLAAHPEDEARVAGWRAQADAIRAKYGPVIDNPVPFSLTLAALNSGRRWRFIAAAAVVAAFLVGGGAGWTARSASNAGPSDSQRITAEAIEAHKVYVVEVRHPVEVAGNERPHLVQWLSKRLGQDLRVPDLSNLGLKLVGGRLLPGTDAPAAFFMYENAAGDRYTMYCAPLDAPQTALHYSTAKQFGGFFWVDNGLSYVVAGPSQREELRTVAEAVYAQTDVSAPRKAAALR